jgi:hypothetical protein
MAQEDYDKMSSSEKKKEDWMNSKWRPMMGWIYMGTCFCDFVLFPILWSLLQAVLKQPVTQWQPLTLQGAGLYHIAMGAVLGIAAYGRTQEKLGGANNGGLQLPSTSPATPSVSASAGVATTGFVTTTAGSAPAAIKPVASMPKPTPTPAASQLNDDLHPDDPPVRNTRND